MLTVARRITTTAALSLIIRRMTTLTIISCFTNFFFVYTKDMVIIIIWGDVSRINLISNASGSKRAK